MRRYSTDIFSRPRDISSPLSASRGPNSPGRQSNDRQTSSRIIQPNERDLITRLAQSQCILDISEIGFAFRQNFQM